MGLDLGDFSRKLHWAKASFWGIMSVLATILVYGGPIAVGIYMIVQGRILFGILFPFIFWIVVGFYLIFLPVIWIIGWFQIGFWQSTAGSLALLLFFNLPDIFLNLAERQALKAEKKELEYIEIES